MPCRDDYGPPPEETKERDDLAGMLCDTCRLLDGSQMLGLTSAKVQKWYKDHKKKDAMEAKARIIRLRQRQAEIASQLAAIDLELEQERQ